MLLAATPQCKYANNLINFFVAHFTDVHYSNVDRLWLGTWNSVLLRAALRNGTDITTEEILIPIAVFLRKIIATAH